MLIAEDLLFLVTDDASGGLSAPAAQVDAGLGGANLMELTLMNKVNLSPEGDEDSQGRIVVRDPSPAGDDVLDAALRAVIAHQSEKPSTVIAVLGKDMRRTLYARLSASGMVRAEQGGVLGVFPAGRWAARYASHEAEVRQLMTQALLQHTAPGGRTAALIALAYTLGCEHKIDARRYGLSRSQLRARAAKIAEGSWVSAAVRKAIDEMIVPVVGTSATTQRRAGSGLRPGAYFRAVTLDVDGTLAEGGRLSADTLYALAGCRQRGIAPILVTGRTVTDLRVRFPRLLEEASAVVAENGACVLIGGATERTAPPLDPALGALLTAKGVAWSSGEVLLACSGDDETTVLAAVRDLGYDYQLVRNRDALMVLPAGVTKGSGLTRALAWLGLSPHSTVGVGDGENDRSLLGTCELAVAVANALKSLKTYADIVLDLPDGEGVAALLSSELFTGRARHHSKRWHVYLGAETDGTPVTLPASQLNVIVAGAQGDGRSNLAGLIAEQLVSLGYSIVVLDRDGDHIGLGSLPGVSVLDARALPGPAGVLPLLIGPGRSVLVNLSGLHLPAQRAFVAHLTAEIETVRADSGLPHWVLVNESHGGMHEGESTGAFDPPATGRLLVTGQPGQLSADLVTSSDAIIAAGGSEPSGPVTDFVAAVSGVDRPQIAELLTNATGRGLLVDRADPRHVRSFTLSECRTAHRRHERSTTLPA